MKTEIASDGSFVRLEIAPGDLPVVRVGIFADGDWREDMAPLNGDDFDQTVLKATKRALGYPDDECWFLERSKVYPGEIDLFATPREAYPMYSGASIEVLSPEGDHLSGEYRDSTSWPNTSLWKALAFAEILHAYYGERGIDPRPFIPVPRRQIA